MTRTIPAPEPNESDQPNLRRLKQYAFDLDVDPRERLSPPALWKAVQEAARRFVEDHRDDYAEELDYLSPPTQDLIERVKQAADLSASQERRKREGKAKVIPLRPSAPPPITREPEPEPASPSALADAKEAAPIKIQAQRIRLWAFLVDDLDRHLFKGERWEEYQLGGDELVSVGNPRIDDARLVQEEPLDEESRLADLRRSLLAWLEGPGRNREKRRETAAVLNRKSRSALKKLVPDLAKRLLDGVHIADLSDTEQGQEESEQRLFLRLPYYVIDNKMREVSGDAWKVFIYLCRRAGFNPNRANFGIAQPTREEIQRATGLPSVKMVQKRRQELEAAGLIESTFTPSRSTGKWAKMACYKVLFFFEMKDRGLWEGT